MRSRSGGSVLGWFGFACLERVWLRLCESCAGDVRAAEASDAGLMLNRENATGAPPGVVERRVCVQLYVRTERCNNFRSLN